MSQKRIRSTCSLVATLLLTLPLVGLAANEENPKPVEIIGTVKVSNLPTTQTVTGAVSVDNLPAVQDVNVTNLPAVQDVRVTSLPTDPQPVVIDTPVEIYGGVSVGRLPDVTIGDVAGGVEFHTRVIDGTVTVKNLDALTPALVRDGRDVIQPQGTGKEIVHVWPNVVMTDLIVYNASNYRDCLVEIGEQHTNPNAWYPFFSFEPAQGLNQISLKSGIPSGQPYEIIIRVGNGAGNCGASLLWSGYEIAP